MLMGVTCVNCCRLRSCVGVVGACGVCAGVVGVCAGVVDICAVRSCVRAT